VSALETNIGPEAATVMRAPFAFGDDPQPGSTARIVPGSVL
jgi:hypothetical protein